MVRNHEYYQMQVRHFDLLLSWSVDQLELITDENDRIRLSQTMTALSNKANATERRQLWIRTFIKRDVQTLRSNLERYYVLRTVQQSFLALDNITDLHQDIIYQHQFLNGKITSFPKYRNVDPIPLPRSYQPLTAKEQTITAKEQTMATSSAETTEVMTTMVSTTTDWEKVIGKIDWEKVYELDEQAVEKDTGLSIPILSSIVDTLIAIGSTIVYGVYQLCISSNNTITSNVTAVIT